MSQMCSTSRFKLSMMFQGSSPSTSRITPIKIDSRISRKMTDNGGPPKNRLRELLAIGRSVGVLMTTSYHVDSPGRSRRGRSRSFPAFVRAFPADQPTTSSAGRRHCNHAAAVDRDDSCERLPDTRCDSIPPEHDRCEPAGGDCHHCRGEAVEHAVVPRGGGDDLLEA